MSRRVVYGPHKVVCMRLCCGDNAPGLTGFISIWHHTYNAGAIGNPLEAVHEALNANERSCQLEQLVSEGVC